MKKILSFISVYSISIILSAQVNLTGAAQQVGNIASSAAGIIGGIIGGIAVGRAGWKFSQGEQDAVSSLIMAIVAVVLGQIAAALLRS